MRRESQSSDIGQSFFVTKMSFQEACCTECTEVAEQLHTNHIRSLTEVGIVDTMVKSNCLPMIMSIFVSKPNPDERQCRRSSAVGTAVRVMFVTKLVSDSHRS